MGSQINLDWVNSLSTTVFSNGLDTKTDIITGDIYTAGQFQGTITFKSTDNTTTLEFTSSGTTDGYFTKYNSSGIVQWAMRFSTGKLTTGISAISVNNSNIYVTGFFIGTVVVPSTNGVTITISGNDDRTAGFLAKYNKAGVLEWATGFSGISGTNDAGQDIAVNSIGDVFITGYFTGVVTFNSYNSGVTAVIDVLGDTDLTTSGGFLARYSSAGVVQWAVSFSGAASSGSGSNGISLVLDRDGNIYVTGQYNGSTTFRSTNSDTITLPATAAGVSTFAGLLAKYTPAGLVQWALRFYGAAGTSNIGNGIAINNNDDVYITGHFTGTVTFGSTDTNTLTIPGNIGQSYGFVAKYSQAGGLSWAVNLSGPSTSGVGIAINNTGNVYVTGYFEQSLTFGSTNGATMTIYGNPTISTDSGFLSVYSSNGAIERAVGFYGVNNTNGSAVALTVNNTGDIYLTGYIQGSVTFYSMDGKNINVVDADVNQNGFIAKYTDVYNQTICLAKGSLVYTDQGLVEINNIIPDSYTINGKKIITITKSISTSNSLICFEKNSLCNNVPFTRTIMTDCHQVLYKDRMYLAKKLVNNKNIYNIRNTGETLYNVLMENHELINVNNLTVETLNPDHPIALQYNKERKNKTIPKIQFIYN